MSQGINRKLQKHLREVIEEKINFPIGVLGYFGPDDRTITKVVAVIIQEKTKTPLTKSWRTESFETDTKVAVEIGKYFLEHQVNEVVMTEGVVGCPHDEGVDYPIGEPCPYCSYWTIYQNG